MVATSSPNSGFPNLFQDFFKITPIKEDIISGIKIVKWGNGKDRQVPATIDTRNFTSLRNRNRRACHAILGIHPDKDRVTGYKVHNMIGGYEKKNVVLR